MTETEKVKSVNNADNSYHYDTILLVAPTRAFATDYKPKESHMFELLSYPQIAPLTRRYILLHLTHLSLCV